MSVPLGLYAEGYTDATNIDTYAADLKGSGFTNLIMGLFHIGRPSIPGQQYGDIIFNGSDMIISGGVYKGAAGWPAQVAAMKNSPGNASSITSIYFSFGGAVPWVQDYTTIKTIIDNERSQGITNSPNNPNSILYQNFAALRKAFPTIDGIDLDNEELSDTGDEYVIVSFSQMLYSVGFKVSFCPFDSPGFWIDCMQQLYNWNQDAVSGFNLQCYAGGGPNAPNNVLNNTWIQPLQQAIGGSFDAASFICAGLWCRSYDTQNQQWTYGTLCPELVQPQCATWSKLNIGGSFIWVYDDLQQALSISGSGCTGGMATKDYANAIIKGFS